MEEIVEVKCPFTGREQLPAPSQGSWALRVPNAPKHHIVWYFHNDNVEIDGLFYCASRLLGTYIKFEAVEDAVETLLNRKDLVKVDDWWFMKVPIVSPESMLTTIEAILITEDQPQ